MGKGYKKRRWSLKEPEGYAGALYRMLPVALFVAVVPLLMGQFEYETKLTKYAWFTGGTINYDFFLGWKSIALTILAFVMAACIAVRVWKEKRKVAFAKLFLPLFGYGLLAFCSACASVEPSFSFSGGYEHFETVWVLLGYVLVVYYAFLYAKTELELQVVADAVCACSTVIGFLASLQGIGLDLFVTKPFLRLITSKELFESMGMGKSVGENTAVATLYNPNYMGVFGSMVIPFLLMMLLFEKNTWRRVWHRVNIVLVMVALLSSGSRAGLIAAFAALCVALVFAFHKILRWWFLTIPAVNFLVVLVLLVNAYNDNAIFDRLKNILAPDNVVVAEETAEDGTVIRKTGLTELYTTKDCVVFTYNEESRWVEFYTDGGKFGFYVTDENGEQAELVPNEDVTEFSFTHPALAEVKLSPVIIGDGMGFRIRAEGDWNFVYNASKETYRYLTKYGEETDMRMAEAFGFENRQRFFSNRGFIWSRTLPLLKDHIVLGSGPDTFILEFPQDDYLMMHKSGFGEQILTKPHSWYLQAGVQTGVLSLVCLLAFYAWYAVWCIRLYAFRKLQTQTEAFGMAAFIGSIGFMISGMTNDSMVVTSPVFWGMIALGVASNFMVKNSRKKA